jgi:hypothetical protein
MKWRLVAIANQTPRKIAIEENCISRDVLVRDHWWIR